MKASMLLVLLACAAVVHAANVDPCAGVTTVPWVEIEEENYDWNYDSPNPIGYRVGAFGEDNSPPYCLQVTGVAQRKVEVMIESQQRDARICVKDTSNPISVNAPGTVAQCGQGKVHACFTATTNVADMNLVFYCDTGCTTGQVTFWHRVRKSDARWTDTAPDAMGNVEMWCMTQDNKNSTIFPSDLMQRDPDIEQVQAPSAASSLKPFALVAPLLAGLAALFQ